MDRAYPSTVKMLQRAKTSNTDTDFTSLSTFEQTWCTAVKLHMAPKQRCYISIPSWLTDVFVQRWKALTQQEGKEEVGRNVDVMKVTRNSHHFEKEKISTYSYMSSDLV